MKKAVEDFDIVKKEMAKAGIEPDSPRFLNVITAFKKYNYNCGDILLAFAEIIDINKASEKIKRERQEINKQKQTLDRRLEETNNERAFQTILNTLGIGLGQLKEMLISLMSLEQQGVPLDQIVTLSRTLYQNRQKQWERRGRDGYKSNNNGGGHGYNNI